MARMFNMWQYNRVQKKNVMRTYPTLQQQQLLRQLKNDILQLTVSKIQLSKL